MPSQRLDLYILVLILLYKYLPNLVCWGRVGLYSILLENAYFTNRSVDTSVGSYHLSSSFHSSKYQV